MHGLRMVFPASKKANLFASCACAPLPLCFANDRLSVHVCTHTALTASMVNANRRAHSKKKKCAGKVGGGGYIRKFLLHETSPHKTAVGVHRTIRIVTKPGPHDIQGVPYSTLKHRAERSAATYAKKGLQSGIRSFLPPSLGGPRNNGGDAGAQIAWGRFKWGLLGKLILFE